MREYFLSITHHRRATEERELRQCVDALERFLLERLVPRTFDDFAEIDALLAEEAEVPSSEIVGRALEQIRIGHAHYRYFFSELASPAWIKPLDKKGFFSSPFPAVYEADTFGFPFWPESEYLARMAPEAPERVAAVMARIPETDNERVHEYLAKAAAGLPPGLAAQWAEKEAGWVSRQERLYSLLPDALGGLVARLAKEGETRTAICLARALLEVRLVNGPAEPDDAQVDLDSQNGEREEAARHALRLFTESPRAPFDPRRYELVLQTHILELVQHSRLDGLALLCDLLEDVLPAGAESGDGWRRAVEPYGPSHGHDDLRHALVDAVRDGSLRLVEAGAEVEGVAGLLQGRRRSIFRRIALHLLSETCSEHFEAASSAALDRANFYSEGLWREYSRLLTAVFPKLDGSGSAKVLGWVDVGPPDRGQDIEDEETRRARAALWRAKRLGVLRGHLPPEWEQRHEEIVAEFGEPEVDSGPRAFVSGPRSPEGGARAGADVGGGDQRVPEDVATKWRTVRAGPWGAWAGVPGGCRRVACPVCGVAGSVPRH